MAEKAVRNFRIGPLFTPPSVVVKGGNQGTIARPSAGGGANWSGAACDGVKIDSTDLNSDLHGSAEYRAALIPVLAKRAVG